jgi:PAS domain-containing protein
MNAQMDRQASEASHNLKRLDHANAIKAKREAVLTLLENGMILNCNNAAAELLGCTPNKLTWQPIARLLPQLADMSLMLDNKINPYLRFLSVAGHRFEVIGLNGVHFACELFFSAIEEFGKCCIKITLQPVRQGQATTLRHLRTY